MRECVNSIKVVAVATLGFLLVTVSAPVAGAQSATPAATPDVPAAAECGVEPVEPMDLLGLLQGGDSGSDLLQSTPVPASALPEGPPASEEELAGITRTVRQLVACANAGDVLRLIPLLTDDFKAALAGAALGLQGQDPTAIAARFPVPISVDELGAVDQVAMIPIDDARLLPDGSVGAILEPSVQGIEPSARFFVTFELVGDQWLIDGVTILQPENGDSTPAA